MRSSIKLINVLVAALLFVTPLTIASAQTGTVNENFDAYFNSSSANYAEPTVVPSGNSVAVDNAFAETNVDAGAAAILAPEALPVTGDSTGAAVVPPAGWVSSDYDSSWTDGPMDLSGGTSLLPEALPVTGLDLSGLTGIDTQTILDEVAAAGGTIVAGMPESLPTTGADLTDLLGLDSQTILYGLAVAGWNFDLDQPAALPMTGGDLSGLNGIDSQTIMDEVAAGSGIIVAALPETLPEALPVTGESLGSALPDMGVNDFAVPSGLGLDIGEPEALPVTGQDVSSAVIPDIVANEMAASGIASASGDIFAYNFDGALPADAQAELAASGIAIDAALAPATLPTTGGSGDVVGFIFDGTTYVPDVAAAALPEALPVTGLDASAMSSDWILQPTWVQADFGFAGYDPIDSVNDATADLPLALPVTGSSQYIWPDDIPYAYGDTLMDNFDSGTSATSNAPVSLPQTGGDRLDVVGGR